MKFIFLTGGFAGFLLAAASGYYSDRPADRVLLDAAVGCLVGGPPLSLVLDRARARHP